MARSSGVYTPPASSWYPTTSGAVATKADWDALLADIASALTQSIASDGQTTITGNLPMAGFKLTGLGAGSTTGDSLRWEQLFSQGTVATLASAATVTIGGQNSTFIEISGTTGILSLGVIYSGPRWIRFQGALTLTHNATTLNLPGAADITTAAGDTCVAIPNASANGWNVYAYQRASVAPSMFLQAGTGAVSRTIQSKLREYVSITDFGTLGVGNDATIFQAAIDAVKGTGNSLYIPPNTTIALGTTGVTIDAGVTIVGANRDRCFITWTSTTMVAITVTTASSCQFQNLYFAGPSSCTNGAAISLSGSGGTANSFSKVTNCRFSNGYRQVYAPDAYAWEISGNYFSGAVNTAIYVGNTTVVDDGDSNIERNVFSNLGASASSIYQVSSGGLRIINNKMNGGLYGYFLELASAAVTSILLIEGNSIENQTHSGVVINNSAGGGAGFSQVCIVGNQFGYQPTPINALDPDAFNAGMIIVGNVIVAASGATTTAGITVTATPKSIISNNILYGSGSSGTGIVTGTLSTDCAVRDNVITGFTTPVNDGGLSYSVASAASITLSTAKDVFTITGTTSITSISAASAVAGRVVTLIFQGALTFTDGSNLKLSGNFVTTADDTITLVCDGTNWYEVARSAN